MLKYIVGAAVVGVFLGAFSKEIINRVKPDLVKKIEGTAKFTVDAFSTTLNDLKTKCDIVVWGEKEENS